MKWLLPALLAFALTSCGVVKETPRECVDDEECFGGEYCGRGLCKPYRNRTDTEPRDRRDLGAYLYDLGHEDSAGMPTGSN